ncbi:YraN family protein [Reichenbachiella versicolor]|uniref:YraN family protein n=1 Tax=Reichenbachiella versicolor TaxID=1821036 RepID=UPI000D6E431C|nr:YraN family protein [Reichenbachiella versicolor]
MISSQSIGREGESIALSHLYKNGYSLVSQNYRHKHAEIDLIVSKGKLLVFVEVKFRKGDKYGYPEEFVSKNQKKMILQAAENYIFTNKWEGLVRFDIISISVESGLVHFEDAFY